MLSRDIFGENVRARLLYAQGLSNDDALTIVGEHLLDGSWRKDAPRVALVLGYLYQRRKEPRALALVDDLVGKLVEGQIDDVAHAVIRMLVDWLSHDGIQADGPIRRIAEWLLERGRPGDAGLVADMLDKQFVLPAPGEQADGRLPDAAIPLALWLLAKGSAELRTPRRAYLLDRMLHTFSRHKLQETATVLRYLLRYNDNQDLFPMSDLTRMWRLLESLLEAGEATSLVIEFLDAAKKRFGLHPLFPEGAFPRCRDALLRALVAGTVPQHAEKIAWALVLTSRIPVPGGLHFHTSATLDRVLHRSPFQEPHDARHVLHNWGAIDHASGDPVLAQQWYEFLVREAIRIHRLLDGGTRAQGYLGQLVTLSNAGVAEGVANALRSAIEQRGTDDRLSGALQVLNDTPPHEHALLAQVPAAIELLPREARPTANDAPDDRRLGRIVDRLQEIVNFDWFDPIVGVDVAKLLRGITKVELASLDKDDKVRIVGNKLLVDDDYPKRLATGGEHPMEDAEALAVLYVLHELVHVTQGIGGMPTVQRLRETGQEMTLMHLDLSADHAAACLAAYACPTWTLPHLKDLAGRSLAGFTVGPTHTSASRARKATRLVGLRLDYLARVHQWVPRDRLGSGYVFADYGPAAGPLLVCTSGPPMGVARECKLSDEEAKFQLFGEVGAGIMPPSCR